MIFITASNKAIVNNISNSTLHITLRIYTQKIKKIVKGQQKIKKTLYNKIIIIINKMSMINLDLLAIVDLHFDNAKALYNNLFLV